MGPQNRPRLVTSFAFITVDDKDHDYRVTVQPVETKKGPQLVSARPYLRGCFLVNRSTCRFLWWATPMKMWIGYQITSIQSNPAISNEDRIPLDLPLCFQSITLSYFELGYFEFPAISN